MGVERYGSKTDVVVKLVLVFFIALLSFSVGTFVGKSFSDNQYKHAKLEPGKKVEHENGEESETNEHNSEPGSEQSSHNEHGSRDVASVEESKTSAHGGKSLSDEEIAKLAQEFVADDKKPEAHDEEHGNSHGESKPTAHENSHGEAKTAAHGAANTEAKTEAPEGSHGNSHAATAEPLKPAQRLLEGKSPMIENPKPPESRIPAALPKEVASSALGKYTVQIASLTSEKEAQNMSAEMKEKGFSAFYVSAKVKGQTRYRVSLGLFATAKEAESYMNDLIQRKKIESAIVQIVKNAN